MNAELLSSPSNFAVVQMPDRKFPGIIIQGDSLHILVQKIREMQIMLNDKKNEDLAFEMQELNIQYTEILTHYEKVCAEHAIPLPYQKAD